MNLIRRALYGLTTLSIAVAGLAMHGQTDEPDEFKPDELLEVATACGGTSMQIEDETPPVTGPDSTQTATLATPSCSG